VVLAGGPLNPSVGMSGYIVNIRDGFALHDSPFLSEIMMARSLQETPESKPENNGRPNRIFASGEMADRTREFDWSKSALGPIELWPQSLIITVSNLLATKHPMFLWWGPDLIQFYNDAYRRSIGSDKHPSALGQRGEDCWPEIWSVIGPQIAQVMSTGEATWNEDQLVPIFREGKLEDVYWTYSYSAVRDLDGSIQGTLVTCTETTTATIAATTLRRRLASLAELFERAPAFFALLRGPDHIFELTNPLYQKLIANRDVIGKSLREALPEVEEQGFIRILDEVYTTGQPYTGRGIPVTLAVEGSERLEERILDFVYQPIGDVDENLPGILVFGVDVTEAKRTEQTLLRSEKLAAVGRLASSIAHEINNPLEAVTNLVYLAQQTAQDEKTSGYLDAIDIELRRASAIASQTLRFHKQSTAATSVTSPTLISDTLSLYQGRLTNSSIVVETGDLAQEPVECFEGEIRQALANLIGNAIDAMHPRGGRLLLRSRKATDWATGRKGLLITVADTGSGIPKETFDRLFEPFFTTKGHGGNGLGLWITNGIVARHEGKLSLRSKVGKGTVATLFLPFRRCSDHNHPPASS
jgi:signal transduction histidine kinase